MARLVKKATKGYLLSIAQDDGGHGWRLDVRPAMRKKTWVDVSRGTELMCFLLTPRVKAALRKALR